MVIDVGKSMSTALVDPDKFPIWDLQMHRAKYAE